MNYYRRKEQDKKWRWCAGTLVIFALFEIFLWSGCSTNTYDGEFRPLIAQADSIPLKIENRRAREAIAPHFLLIGSGRHELGILRGPGGTLDRKIPVKWLGADGCMTIVAHYVGAQDLVFDRFCWAPGEKIEIGLDDLFNSVAAWSHR